MLQQKLKMCVSDRQVTEQNLEQTCSLYVIRYNQGILMKLCNKSPAPGPAPHLGDNPTHLAEDSSGQIFWGTPAFQHLEAWNQSYFLTRGRPGQSSELPRLFTASWALMPKLIYHENLGTVTVEVKLTGGYTHWPSQLETWSAVLTPRWPIRVNGKQPSHVLSLQIPQL